MKITPDILLSAYAQGLFPMAETRESQELRWFDPDPRGILPLDSFHVPRRLQQTMRQNPYRLSFDEDFSGVIHGCATARAETWINAEIISLYTQLHERGFAHSVEAWKGDMLAGGVYGIAMGGAFFGESMFSTAKDASKIALAHLVAHLNAQGYSLFDTQFVNPHIAQFGALSIQRHQYHAQLANALTQRVYF